VFSLSVHLYALYQWSVKNERVIVCGLYLQLSFMVRLLFCLRDCSTDFNEILYSSVYNKILQATLILIHIGPLISNKYLQILWILNSWNQIQSKDNLALKVNKKYFSFAITFIRLWNLNVWIRRYKKTKDSRDDIHESNSGCSI
jgi:hypothetical protein